MTVAELIVELQKLPQDATACFGSYYGDEITKVEYDSYNNEVDLS